LEYQYDFSDLHPDFMFDEPGRLQKARKTVAVILDIMNAKGMRPEQARVLDIGCSTGIMTRHYAEHFCEVTGVDIDDGAVEWARQNRAAANIEYRVGDSMDLPFPSDEFNVVTCTHIYEHVPDAQRMLDEIFRVLKPGGLCYFAAENRLRLWEGHYSLPLLSLLPKPLGHLYIKLMGKGERYYETHRTVWGLRKLTRKFEIIDYTVAVVREPEKYEAGDIVPARSAKRRAALMVLGTAYWAFPTYLWVLRKPRPVKG
jgi:ubiquinone/menaquinone biosynthesis C-methylase UbiE